MWGSGFDLIAADDLAAAPALQGVSLVGHGTTAIDRQSECVAVDLPVEANRIEFGRHIGAGWPAFKGFETGAGGEPACRVGTDRCFDSHRRAAQLQPAAVMGQHQTRLGAAPVPCQLRRSAPVGSRCR